MTQARYAGGCGCKSVRYQCNAEAVRMFNCHCRDCQRGTGSAYAPVMVFRRDTVNVTGEVRYYSWTSERGTVLDRGFCPICGNPISMLSKVRPDIALVYAASLDDPSLYMPSANIWIRSAQPWDKVDQSISCHETRFS
jgi:hypothetical protein